MFPAKPCALLHKIGVCKLKAHKSQVEIDYKCGRLYGFGLGRRAFKSGGTTDQHQVLILDCVVVDVKSTC